MKFADLIAGPKAGAAESTKGTEPYPKDAEKRALMAKEQTERVVQCLQRANEHLFNAAA